MKSETFSGEVTQAYGKALPTPVKFSGTFEAFESYDEAARANELLSNDEHLNVINAKRKASARATATTAALEAAGIAKPDPKSPEVVRENMIKSVMLLHNLSREDAEKAVALVAEAAAAVKS